MRTPFHGKLPPFELRCGVMFFHDWRYVSHGYPCWETADGQRQGLWGKGELPPLRAGEGGRPWGIRLRALPAQKTEPVLSIKAPWAGSLGAPTVIREGGLYRLWYEVVPASHIESGDAGLHNLLCYAESDDGMTWRRPATRITSFEGDDNTNIVYGGHLAPEWGYHGGSVFRDPSAPPAERYKAWHLGCMSQAMAEEFMRKYPDRVDPFSVTHRVHHGMFGAVSPDGLHWTALPECLVMQTSDTQNIACWDEMLGRYVAYFRTWVLGRRSIGRAETDDFRCWPLPETFLWPGADVGPTDTWYCNGKTVCPGAPDHHLLFALRWNVWDDRFFVHMAVSPDGMLWSFPPDAQVITPGERGSWDTGGVVAGCGMVELPGDRVGVPFIGYAIPHKYPRRRPLGQMGWATWQTGRLVALEAPERGEFTTFPVKFKGAALHVNARTQHAGGIRIELIGGDGKPMPGRTLDDCDLINGDYLDLPVTWRGESSIPRKEDEPVSLRVRMASAQLFSLKFT